MPDHPTPTLRDAAEAHVAVVRKALRLDEVDGRMTDAEAAEAMTAVVFSANALRAALAAEDAWRARAEAAIAWVEAHKACDAALRNYSPDSQTYKDAVGRAEKAWGAARRRYEETCRG